MADHGKRKRSESDEIGDLKKNLLKPLRRTREDKVENVIPFKDDVKPDECIISALNDAFKPDKKNCVSFEDDLTDELDLKDEHGFVLGRLEFTHDGDKVDCSTGSSGVLIPVKLKKVTEVKSDAIFILVVLNRSAYVELAYTEFFNRIPCVLVTSGGKFSQATALFLRKLKMELNLPILALTDYDLKGLSTVSAYRCGTHKKRLTYLDVKWLGLKKVSLLQLQIPMKKMSSKQINAVSRFLEKDQILQLEMNKDIKLELTDMLKIKSMVKMESLWTKHMKFLIMVYLPLMLQENAWLI